MQSSPLEQALNPFPFYRRMRESRPLFYRPEDETWQVFRYAEAEQVLNNSALFSSVRNRERGQERPLQNSILNMDPPQHRQFRSLVTQAFTPRAVAQLANRITSIVTHLLDEVTGSGTMDIIDHLAYPLPVIVIAELLGIPREDRALFKTWSDAVVNGVDGRGQNRPQPAMSDYFLQVIEERHKEPQDDLMSALLNAQVDGHHLSRQELLGFCILLLVAGNETTTNLIGNALLCLDEQPDSMEQLYAAPDLIPGAVEEVLRYRSPVQLTGRIALADTVLGNQHIQAGQRVVANIGSANRDEAQFPDPDRFDIRRSPNHHLAFGHGIHFCLGAPLARLETKIALTLLLERFQDIRRVPQVPLEPGESILMHGVKHLPVTFRQRPRSA
ncbi:putative cytochrome P450 YjiB [Reticulibacter mediterranei]|uniref:Putative cytochrome P450 YjiB n=1 Tax=Reticulibacter mediterranei TaxID=2778369 RepID=A0A8J3IRY0_9CHLR|nr:cytochrome P450 [Reticulibacter mediterranei]GHO97513.1 putative cytochrome P450 YjiB [Reticulibacter mediterranei]